MLNLIPGEKNQQITKKKEKVSIRQRVKWNKYFITGSLQRKDPGRDKKRHLPTAQTVTSNSALDPAMRLKVSTHGDNQVGFNLFLTGGDFCCLLIT